MATKAAYIDYGEGAAPATPATGDVRLYAKTDGLLYSKDDAGTETLVSGGAGGGGGDITTDSAWAAKGDLIVATGDNAAAVLTAGANGTVPTYASGETTGMIPKFPPGYELDYVQITGNVSITGTAEGSETTLITGTSQAYAAIPTLIQVMLGRLNVGSTAGSSVTVVLYDGGTFLGRLGILKGDNSTIAPFYSAYRLTPTAATHQYIVKAYRATSDGSVSAGSGGAATHLPSFIRVTTV